ncbi:hypothetical protein NDU88_003214 [Pleurodeles waltl]|uniref:Uncharacterized protein n=1 Tax=Pleurodeles waltl TaxID=8319 RepID=A0AAV7MAD5_PLEWA|nr:hypothetical protein NDU88_003214 [Pleurodeles waltl]
MAEDSKRAPSGLALRATSVSSPQGVLPPPWPARPAAPGSYPVAPRITRRFRRSREPEPAALPVGGSLDAEVRGWRGASASVAAYPHASTCAGGPDRAVQSAVTTPILLSRLPPAGGPLTLGRGRTRRRRPSVIHFR